MATPACEISPVHKCFLTTAASGPDGSHLSATRHPVQIAPARTSASGSTSGHDSSQLGEADVCACKREEHDEHRRGGALHRRAQHCAVLTLAEVLRHEAGGDQRDQGLHVQQVREFGAEESGENREQKQLASHDPKIDSDQSAKHRAHEDGAAHLPSYRADRQGRDVLTSRRDNDSGERE